MEVEKVMCPASIPLFFLEYFLYCFACDIMHSSFACFPYECVYMIHSTPLSLIPFCIGFFLGHIYPPTCYNLLFLIYLHALELTPCRCAYKY